MKEESRGFLGKVERALRAAEILLREEDGESAVGRAYYPSLTVGKKLFRNNGQIDGVKKFLALHSPRRDDHSSRMVEGMATPTA